MLCRSNLLVFDDTVGCGISIREIGLCHFRTSAQCDGVVEVGSYPVEVADVVSIVGEVIGEFAVS